MLYVVVDYDDYEPDVIILWNILMDLEWPETVDKILVVIEIMIAGNNFKRSFYRSKCKKNP